MKPRGNPSLEHLGEGAVEVWVALLQAIAGQEAFARLEASRAAHRPCRLANLLHVPHHGVELMRRY